MKISIVYDFAQANMSNSLYVCYRFIIGHLMGEVTIPHFVSLAFHIVTGLSVIPN